jgi:hypothetical protein
MSTIGTDRHGQNDIGVNIRGNEYRIERGIVRVLKLRNEWIDDIPDPEALVAEVRQLALPVDLLTFVQHPPETIPKFSYPMQWDNLAVLKISSYENWFKAQIPQNARNKIRKADKSGVLVRAEAFSDKLAAGLVELFNETPVRRGKRNLYYGWDLKRVTQGWATELDRSLWLVAYFEEELIGFIKLVLGDHIARTSGTIAKEMYRDKPIMNALLAKAVELCAAKGIPLLVYGRFVYGHKGEDSLTVFKRNNGFQRIDIPRYFVSLSLRGRIALPLGLHRDLKDMVPGPALRLLLNMRSKWHKKMTGPSVPRPR